MGTVSDIGDQQAPAADAVLESHTHQDARRSEPEGEDRGNRRSRDRYGRDRRERGDRAPRDEAGVTASEGTGAVTETNAPAEPAQSYERTPRYPTGFVSDDAQAAPQSTPQTASQPMAQPVQARVAPRLAPIAAPVSAAPVAAPVSASPAQGLPKVQRFDLPVDQLAQVAEGSGLQWVNSDAEKIAAVQAAIAAEPRPVRVIRERPPAIVVDEGPLVLVETKRDLRDMKLPFEQGTLPLQ